MPSGKLRNGVSAQAQSRLEQSTESPIVRAAAESRRNLRCRSCCGARQQCPALGCNLLLCPPMPIGRFNAKAGGHPVGIRKLWRDSIAAFRAGRAGGEALREFQDEQEIQRLGAQWGKAKTPAEREAAGLEAVKYVIYGAKGESRGPHLAEEEELQWSDNPGAREAYLVKRWNNPYFGPSRRAVSTEELSEARKTDRDKFLVAQNSLSGLAKEIGELPSPMTVGDLHKARQSLDELIQFAVSVGGAAKEVAVKADQIRDAVVLAIREAFSGDTEKLEKIERADAYHKDHVRKFHLPIVAGIIGIERIIPDDELVPALVSEDPATISILLDLLPEDDCVVMQAAAMKLILRVLEEGYIDPQLDKKLAVLARE